MPSLGQYVTCMQNKYPIDDLGMVRLELLPFQVISDRSWLQLICSNEALSWETLQEGVRIRRGTSKTKQVTSRLYLKCSQFLENKARLLGGMT